MCFLTKMGLSFLELKDIAERDIELVNPTSPEKMLEIGRLAGMAPGKSLVDFGCGYAEPLVLWAEHFGISGIGIELRPAAVARARAKIEQRGLGARLEVIQGAGAEIPLAAENFDFAACIGASFIWEDIPQALQAMKRTLHPGGKLLLGEPYWLKDAVPPELALSQPDIHSEFWLLQAFRNANLEVIYVLHSNQDEWDRYETGNWYGLARWIEENPVHQNLSDVIAHLHESQEEYFRFGREYFGWALYLLTPMVVAR